MSNELLTINDLATVKIKILSCIGGFSLKPDDDKGVSIANLLKDLVREIERLINNHEDMSIVGLCVRNIFELYLIFLHLNADETAVRDWIGQMHQDMTDIHDGFISLLRRSGIESMPMIRSKTDLESAASNIGIEGKRQFKVKKLAEKYRYEEDYESIYKLCSKVVHPSSLKLNSYSGLCIEKNFQNILIHVGVHFSGKFLDET